ncbi:MAG TPA: D-tagatose-bisphosphate aldolase, class II, non-catalytic subunit [Paenirhodobacter sp.]
MTRNLLADIAQWRHRSGPAGIPSVCSANPFVIRAAMRAVLATPLPLLIEATCNQVNQDGGYTGMTPGDFRRFVEDLARDMGFPLPRIIFGGDHLGPNPWKSLPPEAALQKAEDMIRAYAAAGFSKLHLDCSMGCAGEPLALGDTLTAARAARLAVAAEQARPAGAVAPVYVIGTEVPVPGGALEALAVLDVTRPQAARATLDAHRAAFGAAGLEDAFGRVIAIVVQPGVEFGNHNVIDYVPADAAALCAALDDMPGLVFEAHSTDYQTVEHLGCLVRDGFAILKVGPGLTFALRQTLYGLDMIAQELFPAARARTLRQTMEALMQAHPVHWDKYYHGTDAQRAVQRHYSYSDRIRYYWTDPLAEAAVADLLAILQGVDIPEPLIGQFLGADYADVRGGMTPPRAADLLSSGLARVMHDYVQATQPPG